MDSFSAGVTLYFMLCGWLPFKGDSKNSVFKRTLYNEVSFSSYPEFFKVSGQCKHFILQLLKKDPLNRLTAEEAASQMWGSSDGIERERVAWRSNAVDGRLLSNMTEARVHSQLMAFDNHDPHSGSSCCPKTNQEEGHGEEGNPDPKSVQVDQNLRSSKAHGQASHSISMEIAKSSSDRSESKICGNEAFRSETLKGERSIILPQEDSNLPVQLPSNQHERPEFRVMRGQAGRMLDAVRSANAVNVLQAQAGAQQNQFASGTTLTAVLPTSQPARPRPQTRSLWGWLSRGRSRKEN